MRAARRTRGALWLGLAPVIWFAGALPAAAAGEQPLKPSEVTQAGIADALAPPAAADPAASGPRARGFRPATKSSSEGEPKRASAAVLITFVTNSAELTAESKAALDVIARAMRGDRLAAQSFDVEGHADPRGDAELNTELSLARARSVVSYLVLEHGIDRQRLAPVGKGATEPLNKSRPDAPENRRVTFVTRKP
jgi:OOP family OmpA-OmpF porin